MKSQQKSDKPLWLDWIQVNALIFISRLCGLVREILWGWYNVAAASSSALIFTMQSLNIIRRLFTENNLKITTTTQMVKYSTKEEQQHVFSAIMTFVGLFLLMLMLVFQLMTPWICTLLIPNITQKPEVFEKMVVFLRITSVCYIMFWGIANVINGAMEGLKLYTVSLTFYVINNIVTVLMFLLAVVLRLQYSYDVCLIMCIATVFAGFSGFVWSSYCLKKQGFSFYPVWDSVIFMNFIAHFIPIGIIASSNQFNAMIIIRFTSFLSADCVYGLFIADKIHQVPYVMLSMATSTILLPAFSTDKISASQILSKALCTLCVISSFVGILICLHSDLVISIIFSFLSAEKKTFVSNSLWIFCLNLPAHVMVRIMTTYFYADQKDKKTPIKNNVDNPSFMFVFEQIRATLIKFLPSLSITAVSMCVTFICCSLWYQDFSYQGLAYAMLVSAWVSCVLFLYFCYNFLFNPYETFMKIGFCILMHVLLYYPLWIFSQFCGSYLLFLPKIFILVVSAGISSIFLLIFYRYFDLIPSFQELKELFKNRARKKEASQ